VGAAARGLEERRALAPDDRREAEPVLVDQSLGHQRREEIGAAEDEHVAAILLLERPDRPDASPFRSRLFDQSAAPSVREATALGRPFIISAIGPVSFVQ
jgi:hypothetical protein